MDIRILVAAFPILATLAFAESPTAEKVPFNRGAHFPHTYWHDSERGWHWYEDPEEEREKTPIVSPSSTPSNNVKPAPELAEFERLRKRMEELHHIAVINPSETNVRNYLTLQAQVIDKASLYTDVAQRVIWATPELDYTVQGRPMNAKALEVFDREQNSARVGKITALSNSHVLFFFFRSDCPYCHQFAPLLRAFEAKFGLRVVPISIDGGPLPDFPNPKIDNGIAKTLSVHQVPALFLAEPVGGKISAIGYGVLSESELLERIHAVTSPDAEKLVPSATKVLSDITVR